MLGELFVSDSEELLPYLTVRGGAIVSAARMYLLQRLTSIMLKAHARTSKHRNK